MKVLVAVTVLLASVCVAAQAAPGADEKAIREFDKQWSQAAQSHNAEKAVSFYADDAAVLPFNAPIANTPQAIREMWQHLLSDTKTTISFGPTKIDVAKSGDLAYDLGWVELKTSDAGKTTVEKGKYVVVWKKRNGQWKVVADIFNTDK